MNLGTYELNGDSFSIDKGLAQVTKSGRTIKIDYDGKAPDLGAFEDEGE